MKAVTKGVKAKAKPAAKAAADTDKSKADAKKAADKSPDAKKAAELQEKIADKTLNLEDFLSQLQQLKKLGPLENLLGMLPGMGRMPDLSVGESQLKRTEAIIQSMTPLERRRPEILSAGRRMRIARGSGTSAAEVNDLLKQFNAMKRMMKEMSKMQKTMARKGLMPNMKLGR